MSFTIIIFENLLAIKCRDQKRHSSYCYLFENLQNNAVNQFSFPFAHKFKIVLETTLL